MLKTADKGCSGVSWEDECYPSNWVGIIGDDTRHDKGQVGWPCARTFEEPRRCGSRPGSRQARQPARRKRVGYTSGTLDPTSGGVVRSSKVFSAGRDILKVEKSLFPVNIKIKLLSTVCFLCVTLPTCLRCFHCRIIRQSFCQIIFQLACVVSLCEICLRPSKSNIPGHYAP